MQKSETAKSYLNNFIEINVLLVLFCLPFSKSAVEICVIMSIAAFFLKKIFVEKPFSLGVGRNILIGLSLYAAFSLISLVNSQLFFWHSLQAFVSKILKWIIFFIVTADTIKSPKQAHRIFVTMVFSCALILLDAVYQQYMTGRDFLHYPNPYPVFKFHARRNSGGISFPTASFPYPNDFASWINVYLFAFISMAVFDLRQSRIYRAAAAILSAFLAFFLFLTTSSSALLGALLSLAALVFMNIRRLLVPVLVVLIVSALTISFVPYLKSYLSKGTMDKVLSINDRRDMWSAGWRIFKQHPVIGNGVNTFFEHFKQFREDEDKYKKGSYAHNCYLQMAADIGILGLVSFLYFILVALYSNIRKMIQNTDDFRNSLGLGLLIGIIAFLTQAFFDTNLYSLNLTALFWAAVGIAEGLGARANETR